MAADFLAVAWLGFTNWAALRFRNVNYERVLLVTGAASIAAGLLLWLRPDHEASAIAAVTGGYALMSGGLMLAVAWRPRNTMTFPPKAERRI